MFLWCSYIKPKPKRYRRRENSNSSFKVKIFIKTVSFYLKKKILNLFTKTSWNYSCKFFRERYVLFYRLPIPHWSHCFFIFHSVLKRCYRWFSKCVCFQRIKVFGLPKLKWTNKQTPFPSPKKVKGYMRLLSMLKVVTNTCRLIIICWSSISMSSWSLKPSLLKRGATVLGAVVSVIPTGPTWVAGSVSLSMIFFFSSLYIKSIYHIFFSLFNEQTERILNLHNRKRLSLVCLSITDYPLFPLKTSQEQLCFMGNQQYFLLTLNSEGAP